MRLPAPRVLALVGAVGLAVTGCTVSQDDEMSPPPRRTVTVSPSTRPQPVPDSVPVAGPQARAAGAVGPADAVWVQGSVLHVGADAWDLAPRRVGSFVVAPGGVYFLDGDQLWFTDLQRVRDTGVSGVRVLAASADGRRLRVSVATPGAPAVSHGYDTVTGRAVPPSEVAPASATQLLGTPSRVVLQPGGAAAGVRARLGPGRYGLLDSADAPLVAFDTATHRRVPLRGVAGGTFELVRWTGAESFYGLARQGGRPTAVVACDLGAGSCRTVSGVRGTPPPVFGSPS